MILPGCGMVFVLLHDQQKIAHQSCQQSQDTYYHFPISSMENKWDYALDKGI